MTAPQPTDGFAWTQDGPAAALVCRPLLELAAHFYTTRTWALGTQASAPGAAWAEIARAIGVSAECLVRVRQVHGNAALVVRRGGAPAAGELPPADIVTTDDPGRALAVQAADCAPILLADPVTGAVAAAHAGWRGLAAGVPAAAVRAMQDAWGSRPVDLTAAVGPSIGACCYEVGEDVHAAFAPAGFDAGRVAAWFGAQTRPGHWQFDGWLSARDQLMAAGVAPARIHVARVCTACHADSCCSYRRDGAAAGRLAAVVRPRGQTGSPPDGATRK